MAMERFLQIQEDNGNFQRALAELGEGRKQSHWIWYIFPQGIGLGRSKMAIMYALHGDEIQEFKSHPILWPRYLTCVGLVRMWENAGRSLLEILGSEIDVLKYRTSIELFEV